MVVLQVRTGIHIETFVLYERHLRLNSGSLLPRAKNTELNEDDHILHNRTQRTNQPRQISQKVFLLDRVKEDPRTIRRIPQERQNEEQQRQPLARAVLLVLHNLRDARAEVAHRACVPEDGRTEGRRLAVGGGPVVLGGGHPDACAPGDGPACGADGTYAEDAECVLHPLVLACFLFYETGETARPPAPRARGGTATAAGVASWEPDIGAIAAAEQRLLYAILAAGGRLALCGFARVLGVVVDALGDEDEVGEAEVDCEGDDGGDELGPEGAGEVGHVAYEPDGEEGEGDAVCGGLAVVFDELGDLRCFAC